MADQVDECHVKPHPASYDHLKYLEFVEVVKGLVILCVVRVYEEAKEWSGSCRPHINKLEKKVKETVGPIVYLVEAKEHEILLFIDEKLDMVVCSMCELMPHFVKGWCDKGIEVVKKAPDFVVEVAAEFHRVGIVDATTAYVNKIQPVAEEWIYVSWKQFLKLPFSLTVVHIAAPPTLFVGEKVNHLISSFKKYNLPLAKCVPLLPIKRIETIIKKEA